MSTITVMAIAAMAITGMGITGMATTVVAMVTPIMAVAITVVAMVIPMGATLILILILIRSATAGVGKGVTVVEAKAQFDRAGASRHGFGACGAAGAAVSRIALSFALSASERPCAPGQCASSRKATARAFAASLWSRKGEKIRVA